MHLIAAPFHRRRDDAGFTLVEMLISVAILGIVSAALAGVVLQYLRTTTDTSARLNESTDQQFISTYWQNDVSSLGRRSLDSTSTVIAKPSVFVGSPGPGGCGNAVGSVAVAFAWNEFEVNAGNPADAWNTTPQEVAYVTKPSAGRFALLRVRCKNGVADTPQTVAHNLTADPGNAAIPDIAVTCDKVCGDPALPNRVSMTFTVKDANNHPHHTGYTTTVSADRRQTT